MKKKITLLMMLAFLGLNIGALRAQDPSTYWKDVVTSKPSGYVQDDVNKTVSISDADGLAWLISVVNGYNDQLHNDLAGYTVTLTASTDYVYDMSGNKWTPIGVYGSTNIFNGTFDGGEHIIDGLYINNTEDDYQGLFGYASGAVIKNVTIGENSVISGGRSIGAICGGFYPDASSQGGVKVIENCHNLGAVSGYYLVGGICGQISDLYATEPSIMYNCSNRGQISSVSVSSHSRESYGHLGGMVGRVTGGLKILECDNFGTITDQLYGITGGICGGLDPRTKIASIENCDNEGALFGYVNFGGILGFLNYPTPGITSLKNCKNTGIISVNHDESNSFVGGICGYIECEIDKCTCPVIFGCSNFKKDDDHTGEVNVPGFSAVGGIIGCLVDKTGTAATTSEYPYIIYNCSNAADVVAGLGIGGIIGVCISGNNIPLLNNNFMTGCINTGSISGNNYVGGICGGNHYDGFYYCFSGKITACENTGSVTATNSSVGGIIADGNKIVVENCTNSGEIEGVENVGGICGKLEDSKVNTCQNSGAVTGILAGGICGKSLNDGTGLSSISGCYNTGNIIGLYAEGNKDISIAAGICGEVEKISITNCYNTGTINVTADIDPAPSATNAIRNAAAGIVATAFKSEVRQCYNLGAVGGAMFNGGICSFIETNIDGGISNCYNLGNVEGNSKVSNAGGIVGDYNTTTSLPEGYQGGIQNCYNAGIVKGYGAAAGIAAYCQTNILNSYNSGYVSVQGVEIPGVGSFEYAGGVVAMLVTDDITPTVNNCYYDKQMCPVVNENYSDGNSLLTSDMTSESWVPGGSAFTVSNGLYPQLTVFATSPATAFDQAASIVSVTPAFLSEDPEENVEGVATSPFTVGTGNGVSWSAVSPFSYSEGEVSFLTAGTGTLTVSKDVTVDDESLTVSKDIVMTTVIEDVCWAGSGTVADPYQIVDAGGLVCLAEKVNAGESYAGVYFKVTADIDLSSVCGENVGGEEISWVPIGTAVHPFKGEFDGNHKIISNLYINNSDDYNQGLFGYIKSASIKDVTVSGTVTASHSRAAGLVGLCETSEISGCVNNAIVSGYEGVGGIAGMAVSSNFSSCTNNRSISLTSQHAGGICGEFLYGSMTDCSNSGEISGPVGIGGLVGVLVPVFPIEQANGYMMSGCSNAATVTATVLAAGGVCGGIQFVEIGSSVGVDDGKPYSILKDCTNSGAISCPMAVGGICGGALYPEDLPSGKSSWSSMSDWLVDGQSLLGSPAAFGVVEEMNENVLTNCTNTGKISGQNYVGGISGGLFSGGVISGCSNQGSVTATGEMVGGVLGYANDHGNIKPQILNCSNFNNVTGKQNVAGIVGYIVDGSVSGCYNTGMISGGMFVGGIVGLNGDPDSSQNGAIVEKCFNLGNINGQISDEIPATVAGGVVGGSYRGHVADCYNAGRVSGYGVAGGVAGVIQFHKDGFDYDGENLYNVGQVTCVPIYNVDLGEGPLDFNYRAGISPLAYESKINNCYYDKQMCTAAEPTVQYSIVGGSATNCAAMLTSAMTSESWVPGGSAFTTSTGLYPQLTAFTASPATALDQAASIVSVTPAFLENEENVEGVATNFTVGTNGVAWSHVSGNKVLAFSGENVSVTGAGTEMVAVSKGGVSKYIQMTTAASPAELTWVDVVTSEPSGFDPENINSPEDLAWFISYVNGFNGCLANPDAYGEITADIDMSAHCWVPIGFYCGNINDYRVCYSGSFHGNHYNIDGIRVSWDALASSPVIRSMGTPATSGSEGNDYIGMFGFTVNANIYDVVLASGSMEGHSLTIDSGLGGIAGSMDGGLIQGCVSNVSLTCANPNIVGGIVGRFENFNCDESINIIRNCMSTVEFEGFCSYFGGIVGAAITESFIANCYADAKFTVPSSYPGEEPCGIGGITGALVESEVQNCYSRLRDGSSYGIELEEGQDYMGMITCFATEESAIKYCYAPSGTGHDYVVYNDGSATLYGCGTFTPATADYTYTDPLGGNIITLDNAAEDDFATSGETTLLDALNNWVVYNFGDDTYNPQPDWARFGSALNGDYPMHCYYEPSNIAGCTEVRVITTPDKTNGFPFRFYHHVGEALDYYNAQANGGIIGIYGSDDMNDGIAQSNDENVDVYVNARSYMQCQKVKEGEPYIYYTYFGDNAVKNSTDWYVSLLTDESDVLNVHTGFNLDNSDASGEVGGKAYDWHMVSSPLAHVPVGIAYADETQHPYMTPANCTWNTSLDGLFPTDTPRGSYDFYAYSEPDYHWINLKQNSASHYHQDGANEPIAYTNDTELTAGHGYLIAMDKEVFMQTSGTLNNRDIEVPVTYSGAHNKGLNFLGNPYMSSLDFDEFATANGSLWEGGAYAESYITLDADKKGYITYAKGQSENPEGLSRYVWPNQGFYIAADKAGTATFTNAMRVIKTDAASYFRGEEPANYALVNLKATDSEGSRDMLTVELGRPEVGGARKVKDVENGNGILYSHYQGGDYSIVFTEEGISQVPVWFESREADSYTMTWSTYNGTFSYLHLIDNLTGCDVDMLTNSEYRFTSSTSDYASRFKLVFEYTGVEEDIDSDADGTFAFQMGEQIVVNGEGTLEIVDVQGRILRSERLSGVQSVVVPSVAKGLYLLRLSGSDSVKVQKIVIK